MSQKIFLTSILAFLALTLTLTTAIAADMSYYPMYFVKNGIFDAKIVIGDEANSKDVIIGTVVTTNLARFNLTPKIGSSMVDSDIYNVQNYNAIVIGNPCISVSAATLENNPEDCYEGLEDGTGYIKVFEKDDKIQFLITGLTSEDRMAAAKALSEGKLKNVKKKIVAIESGSGSKKSELKMLSANFKTTEQTTKISQETEEIEKTEIKETTITESKTQTETNKTSEKAKYKTLDLDFYEPKKQNIVSRFFSGIANFFRKIFS